MKIQKQLVIASIGVIVGIFIYALRFDSHSDSVGNQSSSKETVVSSNKKRKIPNVSASDWELLVVNREHITRELNPDLEEVEGIPVDKRIAKNVRDFLAAARELEPQEHLISGYRSVAYQSTLYQMYVEQEIAANPKLSYSEAEKIVQTYSQPPGASEHQTGLAIDMSSIDRLNEADPEIVEQIRLLAPKYGFVLRFAEEKQNSTGIGYEDWHYRYVGKASAQYMTKYDLSLEEYVALLKKENKS